MFAEEKCAQRTNSTQREEDRIAQRHHTDGVFKYQETAI